MFFNIYIFILSVVMAIVSIKTTDNDTFWTLSIASSILSIVSFICSCNELGVLVLILLPVYFLLFSFNATFYPIFFFSEKFYTRFIVSK